MYRRTEGVRRIDTLEAQGMLIERIKSLDVDALGVLFGEAFGYEASFNEADEGDTLICIPTKYCGGVLDDPKYNSI